uniref:Cyclin N-terminal domain-containing protein n=1 Tax=Heterorhabditis bacteriophora TaxID=37862 RepID=A0A1I7WPM2_HETBA
MSRQGLTLRKRSDSLNEANAGKVTDDKFGALTRIFSSFTLRSNRKKYQNGLEKQLAPNRQLVDYVSYGIFGNTDLISPHSDYLNDIVTYGFARQATFPSTSVADWALLGGFKTFALTNLFIAEIYYVRSLPTEVLYLATYYTGATVSESLVSKRDLECLAVAAVRLAAKIESQMGLSRSVVKAFDLRVVDIMERRICEALQFNLCKSTPIYFMRLIQSVIHTYPWQWMFAKFASQLATTQLELMVLRPSLLASVVMRLSVMLLSDSVWTEDCYLVFNEPKRNYDLPHAILCKLILMARINKEYNTVGYKIRILTNQVRYYESGLDMILYIPYKGVVEHAMSRRPGWMEQQARPAQSTEMLGKKDVYECLTATSNLDDLNVASDLMYTSIFNPLRAADQPPSSNFFSLCVALDLSSERNIG